MATLGILEDRTPSAGPIAWFTGALGLVLWIAWRVVFPSRFDLIPNGEQILFSFRDSRDADDFRRLNTLVTVPGSLTSAWSGRGV